MTFQLRHLARVCCSAATIALLSRPAMAQATCFSGLPRPSCGSFVVFEASIYGASGHDRTIMVEDQPSLTNPQVVPHTVTDLGPYVGVSLGYLRVVNGTPWLVGPIGELGFSLASDDGQTHRLSVGARVRRRAGRSTIDATLSGLGAEALTPLASGPCCARDQRSYGVSAEVGAEYQNLIGATAGIDWVTGGATGSATSARIGLRSASYTTVIASVLGTVYVAALAIGLRSDP